VARLCGHKGAQTSIGPSQSPSRSVKTDSWRERQSEIKLIYQHQAYTVLCRGTAKLLTFTSSPSVGDGVQLFQGLDFKGRLAGLLKIKGALSFLKILAPWVAWGCQGTVECARAKGERAREFIGSELHNGWSRASTHMHRLCMTIHIMRVMWLRVLRERRSGAERGGGGEGERDSFIRNFPQRGV
jgi:hypothetical protein